MKRQYFNAKAIWLIVGISLIFPFVGETQEATLEEIIVTATRRAVDISDVPMSITAFNQSQLDKARVVRVDDLFRITPGVQFRSDGQLSGISIRGVFSNIGPGTTGIYLDDTPVQTRASSLSYSSTNTYPELFDLERVEVLRGPQGTTFGSGSIGGTVRFLMPKPNLYEQEWYARSGFSFTSSGDPSFEAGVAVGGPISEGESGFRLSIYHRRDGGFVDNAHHNDLANSSAFTKSGAINENADSRDNTSLRLAYTYVPNETLEITPSVFYQNIQSNHDSAFWDYFSDPSDGNFMNAWGVEQPFSDKWLIPSLNIKKDLGSFTVISNTSYFDREAINTYDCAHCMIQLTFLGYIPMGPEMFLPDYPEFAQTTFDLDEQKVFTQEVRLQSNDTDAQFDWIIGAFYQDSTTTAGDYVGIDSASFDRMAQAIGAVVGYPLPGYLPLFGGVALLDSEYGPMSYQTYDNTDEQQKAIFLEGTYDVSENLSATLGVRYTDYDLDTTSLQGGPFAWVPELVGFSEKTSTSDTSLKLSMTYQVDEDRMFYATAAEGFRAGGLNQPLPQICDAALADVGLTGSPGAWTSDEAWSYEVGTKNRLRGGRLSVDASIYTIDWTDIPVNIYLGMGCNRAVVLNAASATSKGADLQIAMAVTDQFTMSLAVAFNESEYDKPMLGSPDPVSGARPIIINEGNSLPGVVPYTLAFSGEYRTNMFGRDVIARLSYTRSDAQDTPTQAQDPITTTYEGPQYKLDPSVTEIDFQLSTNIGDTEVVFYVDNMLNKHPTFVTDSGYWSNILLLRTIRPRTFGVAFYYRK